MRELLARFRRWIGLDRAVFYVVCGRAWGLISGPVSIYLVTQYFTPEVQGYYYTFGGVLALQVFLEMGLAQCIVQFASHEFARLRFGPLGRVEGETEARSRLISLGRLAAKWYAVLAVLLVIGIGVGGQTFFSLKGATREWLWPWWLLCLATGGTLALLPFWSLLEGCNQVAFIYGCRTIFAILTSVCLWTSLMLGAGLYCGGIGVLCVAIVSAAVLIARWRGLFADLTQPPAGPAISWRNEIWPYQWRIAVSWMSGYFVFNLLTPVLFYFKSPEVAGQMGMTWQLVLSLNTVASAWVTSRAPRMGMLISQRRFEELDRLFRTTTAQAVAASVVGGVALWLAVLWLQSHFAIGARFLPASYLALLIVPTVTDQIIISQAVYLRAHKREPFMVLSVLNGLLTGVTIIVTAWAWNVWAVCLGYALTRIAVLPVATFVWRRCRREWHATPV